VATLRPTALNGSSDNGNIVNALNRSGNKYFDNDNVKEVFLVFPEVAQQENGDYDHDTNSCDIFCKHVIQTIKPMVHRQITYYRSGGPRDPRLQVNNFKPIFHGL